MEFQATQHFFFILVTPAHTSMNTHRGHLYGREGGRGREGGGRERGGEGGGEGREAGERERESNKVIILACMYMYSSSYNDIVHVTHIFSRVLMQIV